MRRLLAAVLLVAVVTTQSMAARDFTQASSHYLETDSAVVTAPPFSVCLWFNSTDDATAQTAFWLGDKDVTGVWWRLIIRGDVANDPVDFSAQDAGAISTARSTSGYSVNTWHHACGVTSANNSRTVYLDGGNSATNTDIVSIDEVSDRTSIGRFATSSPGNYMDGRIAEVAVWSVALTSTDVALLAARKIRPTQVKPASLVAYWPLWGEGSAENDLWGTTNTSLTVNSAVAGAHPPMYYAGMPMFMQAPGAAAAATATRSMMLLGVGQ